MQVKCPRCGRQTEYVPTNKFRPFCSERCQTIDLGAWADEQYRVPVHDPNSIQIEGDADEGKGPSSGDRKPPRNMD